MQGFLAAHVAVNDTAYSFDSLYTYLIPDQLYECAAVGKRVLVPFGRSNRLREGMVFSIDELASDVADTKSVFRFLDNEPVLDSEMLEMAKWLSETTFCTYYDAVKAILPPAMRYKAKNEFALNNIADLCDNLTIPEQNYLQELKKNKSISKKIKEDYAENAFIIDSLIEKNIIIRTDKYLPRTSEIYIKTVFASFNFKEDPDRFKLTPKQKCAMDFILENPGASVKEICEQCTVSDTIVKNLEKSGAVFLLNEQKIRIPETDVEKKEIEDIKLSDHQFPVYSRIESFISAEKNVPKAFLLHGVTGSGKTAVFAKLIEKCIQCGRSVIYLVPEISLTPQMAQYFIALFGKRVALIHSGLSLGRRLDEYNRIKNGEADIVIGTRSAIFSPLENIGLIIIDEEGEQTYKSESAPRYNTITVAKKRCKTHNSVLLLASATPTVESYYLAQKGVYELLTLTQRFYNNPLPETSIIDMSTQSVCGKFLSFSQTLKDAIDENLKNNEQTILLLNRRGYHSIITCRDCHKAIFCPNCSVPMTYHKTGNMLMCHYCGHSEAFKNECPECHGVHLKPGGFGTQKLEEEVTELFPNARILRMDADSSANALAYENAFNDFANGNYDILLGTQMIGKGLDFPNVTLVGVLSVDKALFTGDFKSYEHTFSLITQVIGRAGRGTKQGRAFLQTYLPEHYVLDLAARQDYREFYAQEIAVRKVFLYPPICDLCVIGFSGKDDSAVELATKHFIQVMKKIISEENPKLALRVLGPAKCSFEKIDGKYRRRIILKCKNNSDFRSFLSKVIKLSCRDKSFRGVSLYADLNGDVNI